MKSRYKVIGKSLYMLCPLTGGNRFQVANDLSSEPVTEMLLPVDRWAHDFVTVLSPIGTAGEVLIVTTSKANTTITFGGDCNKTHVVNEIGDTFQEITQANKTCSIKADHPILVAQCPNPLNENGYEIGFCMTTLPGITHFTDVHTLNTPEYPYFHHYFMFIIRTADRNGLLLNGAPFGNMTITEQAIVHDNTEFMAGYFEIPVGGHTVTHKTPFVRFGGFMIGGRYRESFALATGLRLQRNTVFYDAPLHILVLLLLSF